ncbi:MAG: porin [Woeseiaceae bacterium]|nr:porin [Woeseiaceae bacterium]
MKNLLPLLFLSPGFALAQFVDPQNVLIDNVNIVAAEAEGVGAVNILIRDNKLELLSRERIPAPEGVIAVDAAGGYLVGQLALGETPSFIILDGDPTTDFEILLDTDSHTVFAINDGELRRFNLGFETDAIEAPAEEPDLPRWLAYTPPPLAVPTNYGDPDKFNQWQTENTTGLFTAAVVLDRQHWPSQNSASEQQVGDLEEFEGGEIRGFRVGVIGTLDYFERPWVYTVFGATNAFDKGFEIDDQDDFTWFDYRLDIPLTDGINLSVGKQKEPISMERVMSLVQLPMQERTTVSDALLPSRNFGAVVSGNALGNKMSWAGGVFNNFIDAEQSIGNTATQLIGRVTWVPFASADDSNLVHLGAGARFSNAKQGTRFVTEPEFNKSPNFVDTGLLDTSDSSTWNLEASWRRGPYWLHGEYVRADLDAPTVGDPGFRGYHVTGSWILTGEMREYRYQSGIFGPVPIARTVHQDGWGAVELSARYSSLDLTDGLVDGGEIDILSLGANWWLTPVFNVNLNYRFISNDKDGLSGDVQGVMGRVLLILE